MDLREIRREYEKQFPMWEALANSVGVQLKLLLKRNGIPHSVDCRAKEVKSLITKMIVKQYSALERVSDRAGARVVLSRSSDIDATVQLISQTFRVLEIDNKSERLKDNQLGYRGCHIQVEVPNPEEASEEALQCEIQVRSRAENLWNDVSHELLYKTGKDIPAPLTRRVNRLVALVELFDEQVERAREEIGSLSGTETWAVAQALEELFLELTGQPYQRDLTFFVVDHLVPDLTSEEVKSFILSIQEFVTESEERLRHLHNEYGQSEQENPFLNQPESILTWMLLERDQFALRDLWAQALDVVYLEDLARYWGRPYINTE